MPSHHIVSGDTCHPQAVSGVSVLDRFLLSNIATSPSPLPVQSVVPMRLVCFHFMLWGIVQYYIIRFVQIVPELTIWLFQVDSCVLLTCSHPLFF